MPEVYLSHPYNCLGGWAICISLLSIFFWTSAEEVLSMGRNQNWSLLRQNNSKSILRVSNILDLQHIQRFKLNPYIRVGHKYHGIDFDHLNMLKVQNVYNSSDGKSSSKLWKYFKPLARLIKRCCKSSNTNCNTVIFGISFPIILGFVECY